MKKINKNYYNDNITINNNYYCYKNNIINDNNYNDDNDSEMIQVIVT